METEKKYTDLVAKLKEWHDGLQDGAPAKETLELILPQLAESEDERVWQWIREHINHDGTNMFDKAVAWLEKQKEIQFGVPGLYYYDGEKVHYYGSPATEEKIEKQDVDFSTNDTSKNDARKRRQIIALLSASKGKCMASFAKDIDECVAYLIEKQKEQKPEVKVVIPKFRIGDIIERNPKKCSSDKPKKIVSIDGESYIVRGANGIDGGSIGFSFEDEYELVEQNSAEWSEEDELRRKQAVGVIEAIDRYGWRVSGADREDIDAVLDWLKSRRPQPHWKPSTEQISMVTRVCNNLHMRNSPDAEGMDELLKQLEKIYWNTPKSACGVV